MNHIGPGSTVVVDRSAVVRPSARAVLRPYGE